MSSLTDTLDEDLKVKDRRIIVDRVFETLKGIELQPGNSATTLGAAKSLLEFYDLVRRAIDDYESRQGVDQFHQVKFTEEEPDIKSETESIVFSLMQRVPGQFAQGAPMSREHVNLRPRFRDSSIDPANKGYRILTNGYYQDQIVRFTCWTNTNKAANARAEWFEDLMEDYSWWFKLQGVDRVLFWERGKDLVTTVNENKWYGRPIDYYVRTEKIRQFHEKTLEEILIRLSTKSE